MTAVAAVDQGNLRIERRRHGSALHGVTDGNDIGIAADDRDGILQAFALGNRRIHGIVKADGSAAQLEHGGLKRHLCARAWLIKERRQNFAVASMAEIGGALHDFTRLPDELGYLFHAHRFKVD